MTFITNYGLDILLSALIIFLTTYLYFKSKQPILREIVFDLMRKAEQTLGGKTGELKRAKVIRELYINLPKILQLFITEKLIDDLINYCHFKLNDYLDNGYLDNSYEKPYIDDTKEFDALEDEN